MDKNLKKILIIFAFTALVLSAPFFILNLRAPVLIVSDEIFLNLYGRERIKKDTFYNSLVLFRNILTVEVANDASEDIIALAVHGVSKNPYCVIFPLRFAASALMYYEHNPGIRTVVLEGRSAETSEIDDSVNIFKYKTDIEADFFKAGFLASAFKLPPVPESEENPAQNAEDIRKRHIAVFLELRLNNASGLKIKESFLAGMNEHNEDPPEVRYYTSYSDFSNFTNLSCVILAGIGSEFLENKQGVPIIVFTWLDPALITSNVTVIIDDSPWAQAVQAVRLAESGAKEGLIKSEFLTLDRKKVDKNLLRKIR